LEFKKINLEVRKFPPLQLHFLFKRNGQTYAILALNFPSEEERDRVWSDLKRLWKQLGDNLRYREW